MPNASVGELRAMRRSDAVRDHIQALFPTSSSARNRNAVFLTDVKQAEVVFVLYFGLLAG